MSRRRATAGSPSRAELDRSCLLDDADRELVAFRRGDASRLGFALQLVTVRSLGTLLSDPLDVPMALLDFVAEQLEIRDASCLKGYVKRRTRGSSTLPRSAANAATGTFPPLRPSCAAG